MNKSLLLVLLAAVALVSVSACSSHARIGTKHHHVSLGGSVR